MWTLVVQDHDAPARHRAAISKTRKVGESDYSFYWRDRLMTGVFVGDVVTWKSDAGEIHQGIVCGQMSSVITVLLSNLNYYVGLPQLTHLNGLPIQDVRLEATLPKNGAKP